MVSTSTNGSSGLDPTSNEVVGSRALPSMGAEGGAMAMRCHLCPKESKRINEHILIEREREREREFADVSMCLTYFCV